MRTVFNPVFLHSLWRTGSTYVWHKLRSEPNTLAYYEPLHECLSTLTKRQISDRPNAELRHPRLARPYFFEYTDLLSGSGVRHFKSEFSYTNFHLPREDNQAELACYISFLIKHAKRRACKPVFGFCRSTLRVSWMRERFGGLHLGILRDPYCQWQSIRDQVRNENYYFIAVLFAIIGLNRNNPLFTPIYRQIYTPTFGDTGFDIVQFYERFARHVTDDQCYFIYYFIWLASALHSLSFADAICDIDSLSRDKRERERIASLLMSHGFGVDFSDCAIPDSSRGDGSLDYEALERRAAAMLSEVAGPSVFDQVRVVDHLSWLAEGKRRRIIGFFDAYAKRHRPTLDSISPSYIAADELFMELWRGRRSSPIRRNIETKLGWFAQRLRSR